MSKYPRLGSGGPLREPSECSACAATAQNYVTVEFGYMRGTDHDTLNVCRYHGKMAAANLSRFLAHVETKDKYLARQP